MAHDGFSLDDKRQPVAENDIPDIVERWGRRFDKAYQLEQEAQKARLKGELEPLHGERLRLDGELNRLQFEQVIAEDGNTAAAKALAEIKQEMEMLQGQMAPLKGQLDRLGRQFWVSKKQVKANKYDLSASRYRNVQQDETFHEDAAVTVQRLRRLESVIEEQLLNIEELI